MRARRKYPQKVVWTGRLNTAKNFEDRRKAQGRIVSRQIPVKHRSAHLFPNSGRFNGLFLRGGMDRADGFISAAPRDDLVGQDGVALTDLRPAGTARIGAERVDVVTEGKYVAVGSAVRVIRSEGYRHVVAGVSQP